MAHSLDAERLDVALTSRGLARSRSHAATLISAGSVRVDGTTVLKSSTRVEPSSVITLEDADHYVSRGAHKLLAALDAFPVDPRGVLALDAGASTGGFTQVLLERGARSVVAVDVGHDQLAPLLRDDSRVHNLEGINLRTAGPADISAASGINESPRLVTADLSFISLPLVIPSLASIVDPGGDLIVLVKPQFEVGRTGIREGIVRDPGLRADALSGVLWSAWDAGWGTGGLIPSPILGGSGNHEFLAWLSRSRGSNPTVWLDRVSELAGVQK